jgi:hypothetical protein
MKTFLRYAGLWLIATLALPAGLALAGNDCPAAIGDMSGANLAPIPASSSSFADDRPSTEPCPYETGCREYLSAITEPCADWYVDYRVQQMFNSHTCYEFGTSPGPGQYAPLSKLDWNLDSTWTGLRVGVKKPTWDIHFEWLTPMLQHIQGNISDYDWGIAPPYNPASLDSLSVSPERWIDGQKLEIEEECLWTTRFLGMPIELWPLVGFRWQRFDMMAYDGLQVINNNPPPPAVGYRWTEDMGSFNQQYYMVYLGGQLRKTLQRECGPPITLAFQADYGATGGYNIDHHISGYEPNTHRYTMETTGGDVLHLAVSADVPFNCHVGIGVQADYLTIHTTGTHRWLQTSATQNTDQSWDNGVVVQSDQMSVSAYLRYCW